MGKILLQNDNSTTCPTPASGKSYIIIEDDKLKTKHSNGTVTEYTSGVSDLTDLGDVVVTTPTDGQVLTWDSTTSKWVNESATGGVTSVNTQTGAVVLDADDISDSATANKFVTATDKTNLGNLSGTNTGDETTNSIKTKLGAADTDSDGYLSFTDWNIFNSKAPALGTNDNYVTDAEKIIIGNTSGTNTGDETTNSIKTKLGAADTDSDGYLSSTDWNTFNNKAPSSYTVISQSSSVYNATQTVGIYIILCNTTANAITVNLPTAVGNTAQFVIKKIAGANSITIDANGTQTIDGFSTYPITTINQSETLISNNANWFII